MQVLPMGAMYFNLQAKPFCRKQNIKWFVVFDGQTDRWTEGQTDMARSTCLVVLIKKKYPLWGGIIIPLVRKHERLGERST